MEYWFSPLVVSVIGIHLLAVMSPGPDFFMLVRNAITYSRKTGIFTAIGFGLGIGVHVSYSILGIALIISQSEVLYSIIKYAGSGYLFYIGIRSLMSENQHFETKTGTKKTDISALKAVQIGFLTNVLNPKATLFFLSLFTVVIGPDTSIPLMVFLGVVMMINTTLWFSLLAYLITHAKILPVLEKYQKGFNLVFGILLIGVAAKVEFF